MSPSPAPALPDPEQCPTVEVWPTAGKAFGLSRNGTYEAIRRGEIPSIRVGGRIRVPTAAARRLLTLDTPDAASGAS